MKPKQKNKKVAIIYRSIPHYRRDFYYLLRDSLQLQNITLVLIYGQPGKNESQKKDTLDIDWARKIENKIMYIGKREIFWQPVLRHLEGVELIIVEQASKLLINYLLLLHNALGIHKLAFWGHGKNFQQSSASRVGEWVKRILSKRVHWWFAYNEFSAQIVESMGFPKDRITCVQNAIDTKALREELRSLKPDDIQIARKQLRIKTNNIAIYSGGLYPEKRISFLLESLHYLRRRITDFEMIIIGDGVDAHLITEEVKTNPWIHYLGPIFDSRRVPFFAISKLFLMPGAVGLSVLDSFTLEVPMVTIFGSDHGPEIAYLENEINGKILNIKSSPEDYANEVARLLLDDVAREKLVNGCKVSREKYTVETMVSNFTEGVLKALT